jgi:hypothetical protein
VLTSGSAARLDANVTGAASTSALPLPGATRAPTTPKLVWPAAPLTVPHSDVPLAVQLTEPDSTTSAGSGSLTVTLFASLMPPLTTVMVYVPPRPGV